MSNLSEDDVANILSWLPVKSILRFRCVCKSWCKLFRDPSFIQNHLNHATERNNFSLMFSARQLYSPNHDAKSLSLSLSSYVKAVKIDYPIKHDHLSVDIIGSCNGLICIKQSRNLICFWNPSTKEYKKIPSAPRIRFSRLPEVYGFGYDDRNEDYKLVRIVSFGTSNKFSQVQVYTLGSNSWRTIQPIPYSFFDVFGVLVDGALHWMSEVSRVIVSFNLGDERFYELPLPNCFDDTAETIVGVLGGDLSLCRNSYEVNNVDIWVMKDYRVSGSWSKLLTISQPTVFESIDFNRPVLSQKNGEILFEADFSTGEDRYNTLVTYDPKQERVRNIIKVRGISECFDTVVYVESLVSLKSGTYVGQEQGEEAIEPVRKKFKKT